MNRNTFFIASSWGEGAIPQHFLRLSQELVARGHRVILLVAHQRYDVEEPGSNPAIYTWPSRRPTKPKDAIFLYRLIREYQPECLVANFGAVNVMMLVGWLAQVRNRISWYRTLSSQIELDSQLPPAKIRMLRLRKRMVYLAATHIIANSGAARTDIQKVYHVPAHKCRVFFNSLADPVSADSALRKATKNPHQVVCVGRLHRSKGQDVLIRALAYLREPFPEVTVELVGNGPTRESCKQLAQDLGVADRCRFVGSVPHREVLRKMAKAAVTVVPSRSEAFGLVNIESLAVGTPVIASRVGGISEIVRDGVDGFLVPPDDPAALAEKLGALLSNAELRRQMGLHAREGFLSRFEQRRAVAEQADWLESLVNPDDYSAVHHRTSAK